ncbi:hypothetical protein FG05_35299 [Fusarium graminearum]|nr:hypothetical protein FG05_35299 [Fusarium graminearum]
MSSARNHIRVGDSIISLNLTRLACLHVEAVNVLKLMRVTSGDFAAHNFEVGSFHELLPPPSPFHGTQKDTAQDR